MPATIRSFRAVDSPSALAAAKAAMGPEAVIISMREIGGGILKRREFEVTAAMVEEEPSNPEMSVPRNAPANTPPAEWNDELRRLRSAVDDTRSALLAVTNEARTGEVLQLPPAAARLIGRLQQRGVEDVLAEEIVRQGLANGASPGEGALLAAARSLIAGHLRIGEAPWGARRGVGRKILALVGPTGVGKSTSVAKIAARAILEHRRSLALITIDTYRIGAADQIAHYGEIMNAPTFVAGSPAELTRALAKCSKADLVLIDTAGRSNPQEVCRQAEMIRSVPGVEMCLVVSAACGARDMAAVADRYRDLGPDWLLVSKIDEAAGPASFLSAASRLRRPVIAVADGQRIPEDIHEATEASLASLVLGSGDRPLAA